MAKSSSSTMGNILSYPWDIPLRGQDPTIRDPQLWPLPLPLRLVWGPVPQTCVM